MGLCHTRIAGPSQAAAYGSHSGAARRRVAQPKPTMNGRVYPGNLAVKFAALNYRGLAFCNSANCDVDKPVSP